MAIFNNFDIKDLADKNLLIGVELQDKQGVWHKVINYRTDNATNEMYIVFEGNDEAEIFSIKKKFTVKIDNYTAIRKFKRKFRGLF